MGQGNSYFCFLSCTHIPVGMHSVPQIACGSSAFMVGTMTTREGGENWQRKKEEETGRGKQLSFGSAQATTVGARFLTSAPPVS